MQTSALWSNRLAFYQPQQKSIAFMLATLFLNLTSQNCYLFNIGF